ncbi:MAG TPA: glycosyltransferase family 2 protein [Pelobium sp.]|nr:glycosyltransferase family 2 protein [Pelobium sp.]
MTVYSADNVAVSVIIPFFNNHLTIQETLDSLENQEFKNFEVILVEDKNSRSINPEILKKPYNFKFYFFKNTGNAGASSNRNLGIKNARGKYLQFLDSDDLISNNKLQSQFQLIGNYNNVIAMGRWGVFEKSTSEYKKDESILYKNWQPDDYLAQLNGEFNMLTPLHSYLIPKALLYVAGLWNENISLGDDGEFMNRAIAHCKQILYTDKAIAYYRRGDNNSLSHQANLESAESNFNCAQSYKELVVTKFPDHPKLLRSVIRKYNLFFYWSYQKFPDLAKRAEFEVKNLNGRIDMKVGSSFSKTGQRILGVKLYLTLRYCFFSK